MSKIYTKHGYATGGISSTYSRWYRMIERCHNPKCSDYKYYGGRGIKVCLRWRKSIKNFVIDMGIAPKDKTLDRKNNNGNYCKSNCRWASRQQQKENQRERSNSLSIEYNNEKKPLYMWAKELKIKYVTLHARIFRYKWSIKRAFTIK